MRVHPAQACAVPVAWTYSGRGRIQGERQQQLLSVWHTQVSDEVLFAVCFGGGLRWTKVE